MSKVRILIIEDEMIIAEDMRDMLEGLGYEVVGVTGEPDEAKRLLATLQPDVTLVDITLGVKQDGLALGQHIRETYDDPFIFCTSHADKGTIEEAKLSNPDGYLVKPFDEKDLYSSIEIALSNYAHRQDEAPLTDDSMNEGLFIKEAIFVKTGHMFVKVKFSDIQWMSADGNYTTLHTSDQKKHVVRMALKDLISSFPKGDFYRTHRSHIVNLQHVDSINNQHVYIDGHQIPLGRQFRDELLKRVNKMH